MLQIAMDDRTATLVSNVTDAATCAQLARNPSPHFYVALKVLIQQNSRAWLQRQMLFFNSDYLLLYRVQQIKVITCRVLLIS